MATDTACAAGIDHGFTFILGYAAYHVLCIIRDQLDQALRTGCHSLTTRLTCLFINLSNAIYDVDRIKGTRLNTGSVAETAIVT